MKNQPITPLTQPDTAELRAVSPFVRFLEASFFTEIFRREALSRDAREASEVEPPSIPADPPKVKRAAAGAQQ